MTTRAETPRRGSCKAHPTRPLCFATQDELVSLDNAVATEGGTARAFMDYVAVVATPQTGFMAIAEYIKNIRRTAGVRIEKVEVYAPWLDARTLEASPHRLEAERACSVSSLVWGAGPPLVVPPQATPTSCEAWSSWAHLSATRTLRRPSMIRL